MHDGPPDEGRSGDGDDSAAADRDSKAGAAQHRWEQLCDVGVADAPQPAEGGYGDRPEDLILSQRVGGGRQDGRRYFDDRGEDRRRPSTDSIGEPGPQEGEDGL